MTNVKSKRKIVIGDAEVQKEIDVADQFGSEFQRLQKKAIVALLETGKRRGEVARLECADLSTDDKFLYVRFTLEKKRKKNLFSLQVTKSFTKKSVWARYVLDYLDLVQRRFKSPRFLFPRSHFGYGHYSFDPSRHMDAKQIWRVIKSLDPTDWPHLHRERRAVKVIRIDEKKFGSVQIETVFKIKKTLDLNSEETAWNYIRRHEIQNVEEGAIE